MNIYIVAEGIAETKIYPHWVPLVNPVLSHVQHIAEIVENNFAVISGRGYPQYFDVINRAILDVNDHGNIDRLVIAVDSEEMSFDEKHTEIRDHAAAVPCDADVWIVIQHFCIEAWALGNVVIVRKDPHLPKLKEYKSFYDVRIYDPELLPAYAPEELNRAQFAQKYLRRALNDKYGNLTYSKSNPGPLLNAKYFGRVRQRYEQTGHINSFQAFLGAFENQSAG